MLATWTSALTSARWSQRCASRLGLRPLAPDLHPLPLDTALQAAIIVVYDALYQYPCRSQHVVAAAHPVEPRFTTSPRSSGAMAACARSGLRATRQVSLSSPTRTSATPRTLCVIWTARMAGAWKFLARMGPAVAVAIAVNRSEFLSGIQPNCVIDGQRKQWRCKAGSPQITEAATMRSLALQTGMSLCLLIHVLSLCVSTRPLSVVPHTIVRHLLQPNVACCLRWNRFSRSSRTVYAFV